MKYSAKEVLAILEGSMKSKIVSWMAHAFVTGNGDKIKGATFDDLRDSAKLDGVKLPGSPSAALAAIKKQGVDLKVSTGKRNGRGKEVQFYHVSGSQSKKDSGTEKQVQSSIESELKKLKLKDLETGKHRSEIFVSFEIKGKTYTIYSDPNTSVFQLLEDDEDELIEGSLKDVIEYIKKNII